MTITVGSFPYSPGSNPYQRLFTESLEGQGVSVDRLPPAKWFPVQKALSHPCDVMHFDWPHDWYSGKNAATRFLKSRMYLSGLKKRSISKLVWTAHNLTGHDAANAKYEERMLQALINRCDGILVMSAAAEGQMRQRYQIKPSTKVQTAFHGHYIDCYPNEISREDARTQLKIQTNEQVFLAIGTIRPYKGHLELIRAFGQSARKGQRLVIAGKVSDPEYRNSLEVEAQRHNELHNGTIDLFLSLVPDSDLQVYFNAADICVLPFSNILNSGSLLMAMSFGIPVVAPDLGSIPEVILKDSSFLFPPNQSDALADALSKSADLFADFGSQDRTALIETVRDKYAWSNFGASAVELYQQVLGKSW